MKQVLKNEQKVYVNGAKALLPKGDELGEAHKARDIMMYPVP